MLFRRSVFAILALTVSTHAFTAPSVPAFTQSSALMMSTEAEPEAAVEESDFDRSLKADIRKSLNYKPGAADTEFAKRYGHLVGKKIKTVGEAFAEFTEELGFTVNALYKNMVTDIVGTTHLIVVNARFQRDPVWSLGIITALDLLLKNYPEQEIATKIKSALFKCIGMNEAEIMAEAKSVQDWAAGKTKEDVEAALSGEGDGPIAALAKNIKGDEFWMYSRYFGIGLLKVMESVGQEMDKDEVYPVIESWMTDKLGRSHLTACADSDLYFKIRDKLDMMETMMKEIEIREKKRMAERLEEKAEAALRAADKEVKMQAEIDAEAQKNRERVESS
ncbi:Protein THYLAKOID FORMATION1, chloroplastic [Seminavis robusta]|uniref:Protein THYLAKOID FORMATION1, chloroplastic n=1 Tax=Seminavis robusta TaxID=568900 RepID=A0A9N8H0U0_9STRA|nr:Protein THYLAKOID FORMATION1, chloroplastic [Seminavis robusta]|eukprot:Sro6_g005120.1 Protein THYLAKOID FORMATION1, chloroplastic (334) ;mRNA; f:102952-104311